MMRIQKHSHNRVQAVKCTREREGKAVITGEGLRNKYKIAAVQGRYRENGYWYHPLNRFPGVLFDANGYVLFETESQYENCAAVKKGPDPNHIHVSGGIASLPFYVLLNPPPLKSGL